MKKILAAILLGSLLTACGSDEPEKVDNTVTVYKTAEGLICKHRNAENITLCYDSSGKIVVVDDPNGVLTLYERSGVDTVD